MDMTTNQNISKEFRKRLDMINRWKKKQKLIVTGKLQVNSCVFQKSIT